MQPVAVEVAQDEEVAQDDEHGIRRDQDERTAHEPEPQLDRCRASVERSHDISPLARRHALLHDVLVAGVVHAQHVCACAAHDGRRRRGKHQGKTHQPSAAAKGTRGANDSDLRGDDNHPVHGANRSQKCATAPI